MEGAVIGDRYVLEELLGKGGAAEVWRARDSELEVQRAVKILTDKAAARQTMRRRLKAEARALARLNHPHVLRVLDIGIDHARPYLVMELVTGGSVSDKVRRQGPLAPSEAIVITLEVLSALAVAHGHGIVHRDIKPQNILIDEHGHAVVADFGIALVDKGERKTRTGVAMGSFAFMPPEQRVDAKRVGPGADLYSTACTLFWMLTGRTPVDLFTDDETSPRWEAVPVELRSILRWATMPEPEDRPRTAAELSTALGALAPDAFVRQKVLDPARFPAPMATLHGVTSASEQGSVAHTGAPSAFTATPDFLLADSDDDDAFGITVGDTHILPPMEPTQEPLSATPKRRRAAWLLVASVFVLCVVICLSGWSARGSWLQSLDVPGASPSPTLGDSADAVVLSGDDVEVQEPDGTPSPEDGVADPSVTPLAPPTATETDAPRAVASGTADAHPPRLSAHWTGSFDGHPMDVALDGPPDQLRGNVRVSLRGNAVDTPVTGAWDAATGVLTLRDELETADAGRYKADLRGGRLHGTFETRYRHDTMREPRVLPFTLRPVQP